MRFAPLPCGVMWEDTAKTAKLQATWDIALRVARENRLIGKEKPILLEQSLWAELESFAY